MQVAEQRNYRALFDEFKRERQFLTGVSANTLSGYEWAWKAFSDAFKPDRVITKSDIVSQIAALRAKGLTPGSRSTRTFGRSIHSFGGLSQSPALPSRSVFH